jgi:hypothetical protein
MPEIKFTFGRTSISMEMPSARVQLSTADVESLIFQLAKFRAEMSPEVVRTLPNGKHENGIVDPIWALPSHPASPEKTFFVRHPGFGWILFFLPSKEAIAIGNGLLLGQQTSNPPTTPRRQ